MRIQLISSGKNSPGSRGRRRDGTQAEKEWYMVRTGVNKDEKIYSPRGSSSGNGGRLSGRSIGTSRVDDVDRDSLTSGLIYCPGVLLSSNSGGQSLEDGGRVTRGGNLDDKGSLTTSPLDEVRCALLERGGCGDTE